MMDTADTPAQALYNMTWQAASKKYGDDFNENN